jgi:periplasmic divalent cation tolerance protein
MGDMAQSTTFARVALTTTADVEEAGRLGRILVEERLAACATIIPAVRSIYRWKGEIEDASETLLLLKTSDERVPALQERLITLHSYETPEFLVLPVDSGDHKYLTWLASNLIQG